MDLRSQLAPSHLHRQPLHRHRPRPPLLPRLLHHLPCLHRLHKFVRLADRLLDRSHVSHLRPPPRPPAPLSRLLLSHCGQRTRHTFRTSPGRCSCGQISGQVINAICKILISISPPQTCSNLSGLRNYASCGSFLCCCKPIEVF